MSPKPAGKSKSLLGYTLKERIGAGGYGEVWSADAPGGLSKAVKLVYGFHDEKRAQTELKAMDRIKQVRHPFLLSLERIEIFEGQLVVVTELADMSLADLFEEHVVETNSGIPRDELLRYIRDAAEGLDYLSEAHSLQHLDVKPENLLIVSGHVKVADFGLVKDLQDASLSLMTGMTPAYAAPELFDGKPTRASDQYSLAIVYQEMLTGMRPFPGTTPAQLAAQHMHGRPNLRPLPKSDQPIIAKALSKDPAVRFENCRTMIDELTNRRFNKKRAIRRVSSPSVDSNTLELGSDRPDVTAVISQSALPFHDVEMQTYDPPECKTEDAEFQPTLIVSVGNTANKAAQKLKQRLVIRHGNMSDIPAVRLLCIDSDRNDLTNLTMESGVDSLSADEVIEIPLSKPENYRERANSDLGWLSRRWIYNIPRTLQTEGLRPLGRLAFVDHFEKICDVIQAAIQDINEAENIAKTSDSLGINPAATIKPRIFIVSSISGGLGSGMTLDLAYTVKTLLAERGLELDSVNGILLHSTNQRARDAGISSANAFTFLTELRHFNDYGFPGDEKIGLPEFQDDPPLDSIYFLDMGVDLPQTVYENELEKLAEYIYLNTVSKCSVFFDECRKLGDDIDHFSLRTFGLSISGPGKQLTSELGTLVARKLLKRWNSQDLEPTESELAETKSWFTEFELYFDGVANSFADQFHEILGDESFAAIADKVAEFGRNPSPERGKELREYLDEVLGCRRAYKNSGHIDPEICNEFDKNVSEDALAIGEHFASRVFKNLEDDKLDLAAMLRMIHACEANLSELRASVDEQGECCDEQLNQLFKVLSETQIDKPEKQELVTQYVESFFQFRIQDFILRYSKAYCRSVNSRLASTKSILKMYSNQLDMVNNRFSDDSISPTPATGVFNMEQLMMDNLLEVLPDLVDRVEIDVYHSLIAQYGGYSAILNESMYWQNHLPIAIHESTQRTLSDALKKVSLDEIIKDNEISLEQLVQWLNEKFILARPVVSQCGGGVRTMIGVPQHSPSKVLGPVIDDQFSVKPVLLNGTCGDVVFCFEGEDVSLANVAYRLLEQRPDAAQLAKRIYSRNDIEWTTLEDLL